MNLQMNKKRVDTEAQSRSGSLRVVLLHDASKNYQLDEKVSIDENLQFLVENYGKKEVNKMLEIIKTAKGHKNWKTQLPKFDHIKPTYIQDSVHGPVRIDPRLFCIIDTPEFQRMRWIHQVGTSFLVCPSVSHTRFSHSIGTYHVAKTLLNNIYHEQRPRNLNRRLIFVITTAALIHDIGHGPFSHVLEGALHSLDCGEELLNHEEMGRRIIDAMYEKYEAVRKEYSKVDIELIKALIEPELPAHSELISVYTKQGLRWIFNLLSGPIDVDKLDYLWRDGYYSGLGPRGSGDADLHRVLTSVRVIDNKIAFSKKVRDNILDIMRKRWSYHKRVYQHKTTIAFDILITEVLIEYFKVKGTRRLLKVENYTKLDDSIIGEIRRSTDPKLARARFLVNMVDVREQPRLIWSCKNISNLKVLQKRYNTEENFSAILGKYCAKQVKKVGDSSVSFLESDIFVRWGDLSLGGVPGFKNKHPLTAISIFDPCFPNRVEPMDNPKKNFSLVGLGSQYVEYWIGIYVRFPHQQELLRTIVQGYFVENLSDEFDIHPRFSTVSKNISQLALGDLI